MKKCIINSRLRKLELNKNLERELRKEKDLDSRESRLRRKNLRI